MATQIGYLKYRAWLIFQEAIAPAKKVRDETINQAWAIYGKATVSAFRIYKEAIDQIEKGGVS